MELRDFEAFVAVAEELHFGRAADVLGVAQPPLSNRIRKFEQEIGIELFRRSTRSVELTESGKLLLPEAYSLLQKVDYTRRLTRAIRDGSFGMIRLGFAGASSQNLLSRLGRAVKETYPDIELRYQSQTYVHAAIQQLKENKLDLAFARLPIHSDLSSRIVQIESFVCAVPDDHPLSTRQELSVSELAEEDFISLTDGQGSLLRATMMMSCRSAGFEPKIIQHVPDSATALALVAAGLGVTITLSTVAETRSEGIAYIPLKDSNPSQMFATLTWRRNHVTPQLARVLEISEEVLPTPDLSNFQDDPLIRKYCDDL